MIPDKRVIYKTIGNIELSMDIFLPTECDASAALPGIIFFHGGGWNSGSPSQFHPHCQYFASRGIVTMSAEYRLAERHGTTPYECVADGKSAIRWIRLNAVDIGVDPNRLVAGGGSAGGHVATAAAMVAGYEDDSDEDSISPKPAALILFNPVFDNGPGGFGHDRVKDRWQDFSPLHNVDESAPPTIVFLGAKDLLIPVATAEEFKKRMSDVGARCDVWVYTDQPHGFFNYRDGSNPYYNATVYEADRFMASLGYLSGEPSLQNKAVEATRL